MYVPRYYDGSPQLSIYLTQELHDWVHDRGGRAFVRQAIMNEYNKKHRDIKDFIVDFGKNVVRVKQNVRLHPAVHEFVLRVGGAAYVRDMLYRMMIAEKKMIRERERDNRVQ